MENEKFGALVRSENGELVLETGAYVVRQVPDFAEHIGKVASEWAQAEAHLSCFFALLMGTKPEDERRRLSQKPACQIIEKTRKAVGHTLTDDELKAIGELLERLDTLRDDRNRCQHDLWAKKAGDNVALYAVRAEDYLLLLMGISDESAQSQGTSRAIELVDRYVLTAANRFTIERLERLHHEIKDVGNGLAKAFLNRVRLKQNNL